MPISTSLLITNWFTIWATKELICVHQIKCHDDDHDHDPANNRQSYATFKWVKAIQYLILLSLLLRTLYVTELKTTEELLAHLPYNPTVTSAILHFNFLRGDTLKVISLLMIFAIHIDYIGFIKTDVYLLKIFHQMFIGNGEELFTLNRQTLVKPEVSVYRPFQAIQQYVRLGRTIWRSSNLKWKQNLPFFGNVSPALRARLFIIEVFIEWTIAGLLIIFALTLPLFTIGFTALIYNELSLPLLLFSIVDSLIIDYATWNAVRVGLFLLKCGILSSVFSSGHLGELTALLRSTLHQPHLPTSIYPFLRLYYSEYRRLKYFAEYVNRVLISDLFAGLFLTNIAVNIVMLSYLIFTTLYPGERAAILLVCSAQFILPMQGCAELIIWSKSLYNSERILFKLQHRLTTQPGDPLHRRALQTTAKVQLLTFYELVCTKRKFRFTCGSFGAISNKSMYEFFFFYTGMLMYVAKIVRKHRNELQ